MSHFKLGPGQLFRHEGDCYIALDDAHLLEQRGADMIISRPCRSFAELKAEVDTMKAELDKLVEAAKSRFDSA